MKDTDFAWLAGFMEGEGSFFIAHQKRKGRDGDLLRATISVDNTDPMLILRALEIYESLGCSMHVSESFKDKSTKLVYRICTANAQYVKNICEALIPYLVGEKQAKAKLLLKFASNRLRKRAENNKAYDEEDWSIFNFSRSSETTREAPTGDDIVHST